MSDTLDANWRRQSQSWADIVANQKAIEQKISAKQKEEAVLVTNVINTSQQKIERDNIEREKRKRNVVIRELEESEGSSDDRKESDKDAATQILSLQSSDVIQVWRAGPPKRNYNRPLIVTVSTPELAQKLHNYGRGRRVENLSDDREFYWCNPDLIETDRKANYKAREEARRRRSAQGGNRGEHHYHGNDQTWREHHYRGDDQPRRENHLHRDRHPSPANSETSSRRSVSPQHSIVHEVDGHQGFT